MMISGFGIKREQRPQERRQGDSEVALLVLGEDVHGLGDLPRDSHHSSELQSISPPSLEAANCSIGTAVITVLQER